MFTRGYIHILKWCDMVLQSWPHAENGPRRSRQQRATRASLLLSYIRLYPSKFQRNKLEMCVYICIYIIHINVTYIYIYILYVQIHFIIYSSYTCCTLSILIRDAPKKSHAPTIHSRYSRTAKPRVLATSHQRPRGRSHGMSWHHVELWTLNWWPWNQNQVQHGSTPYPNSSALKLKKNS